MKPKKIFYLLVTLVVTGLIASTAFAKNPYLKSDDTWISIDGTVTDVSTDNFTLDYGTGTIVVEMDDGDRDADAYKLVAGDNVTVNGKIDRDFYENTTIEAASVYVEKLGTYFYASAIDEEAYYDITIVAPFQVSNTVIKGIVTDVADDEFKLDTGDRSLTVEVGNMIYDPLDDKGYQKVEVGDYVQVTGKIDDDLFEGREFKAETIVEMFEGS